MSSLKRKKPLVYLQNKKIALLGNGLENRALSELLRKEKISATIVIKDAKTDPLHYNHNLAEFDILFRSPGWPLSCPGLKEAAAAGRMITSPLNLFFSLCPTKNIIGITGTKGKGTTASLIYKILKDAGKRVFLGGNIGVSPLSFLPKIKPGDYVVLELSSFQLEDLKYSPRWSIITNLFREHLAPADPHNPNFHTSLEAYWRAKLKIAEQPTNRYLLINSSLKSKAAKTKLPGKIILFSASSLPSKLIGDYNRDNVGAAVSLAKLLKIPAANYQKTIARFANLEHRLELVGLKNGVKYYDNSFSTTPESTTADLESFSEPIILIAGGADKGADFSSMAKAVKAHVKQLILLPGKATSRLKKEVLKKKFPLQNVIAAANMKKAVQLAYKASRPGDTVILSTGCASFGLFKNYKERGDLFKKYVRQIKH